MQPDIFQIKKQLLLFQNDLAQRVSWEQECSISTSEQIAPQPWEKTEAYSWIFFELNYLFFWGASDKTHRKQPARQNPANLLMEAESYYSQWGMQKREVSGYPTLTVKTKEIYKYKEYGIPKPLGQESLISYIERLRSLICKETYSKKIWRESLGSFLEFVRAILPLECLGFIDVIFPETRAFYSKTIIRLSRKEKFPTNIIVIAQILKNLTKEMLWGDQKSQCGAAKALGFSWLCLTSARLQLPTNIKLLRSFDYASLTKEELPERRFFPYRYLLKVPTLYGHIPAEISEQFFDYLCVLTKHHQNKATPFFQASQRSQERAFDRAVNQLSLQPKDGEITFTTLTSWPNEVIHQRTQIDNSRYSIKDPHS